MFTPSSREVLWEPFKSVWQACLLSLHFHNYMALGQNLIALVNIKIAGKWVFTPLTLITIGFDTHTHTPTCLFLGPSGVDPVWIHFLLRWWICHWTSRTRSGFLHQSSVCLPEGLTQFCRRLLWQVEQFGLDHSTWQRTHHLHWSLFTERTLSNNF